MSRYSVRSGLSLDFKKIGLSERQAVEAALGENRMCDLTFGNLFCYNGEAAFWEDSFALRWGKALWLPVGPQREMLTEQLLQQGVTRFSGVDEAAREWLETTFPGRFAFKPLRDSADYIYDREALMTLRGKKLAAKRNHIHYFEQNFSWETKPLNQETMAEALAFNDWWCQQNDCIQDLSLARETCAVRKALTHFEELSYTGLVLYADGKVCAFTYGEPLGETGFCVHAEKADGGLRGAYPMINREFVKTLPRNVLWINREDDAGDEGLRKAKLSYHPAELLMKYIAEVQ